MAAARPRRLSGQRRDGSCLWLVYDVRGMPDCVDLIRHGRRRQCSGGEDDDINTDNAVYSSRSHGVR